LILSFDKIELRELCINENVAKLQFGMHVALKLQTRIAELRAYNYADEILFGTPILENETAYSFPVYKVALMIDGYNIYFCSNHIEPAINDNNVIDWSRVSRIKIIEINNN